MVKLLDCADDDFKKIRSKIRNRKIARKNVPENYARELVS